MSSTNMHPLSFWEWLKIIFTPPASRTSETIFTEKHSHQDTVQTPIDTLLSKPLQEDIIEKVPSQKRSSKTTLKQKMIAAILLESPRSQQSTWSQNPRLRNKSL